MATVLWGPELVRHYDDSSAEMFDPAVIGPTADVLAELAQTGEHRLAPSRQALRDLRPALAIHARRQQEVILQVAAQILQRFPIKRLGQRE